MTETVDVEALKARARAGDAQALQQLRDIGFFQKKAVERAGFAVSHAQRRLWVLDRMMDGRSSAYNVAVALRLHGPLDRDALGSALDAMMRRHESLRTRFAEVDGEPRQFVDQVSPGDVPVIDLGAASDRDAAARAEAAREAAEPFDLARAPLLRARLLRLDRDEHVLLLTAHHIVFDQWSAGVFVRDLGSFYSAFRAGVPPRLAPLAIQYKDFAAWQNRRLGGPEVDSSRRYWLDNLRGPIEPLALPADRPRRKAPTFEGGVAVRALDRAAARGFDLLARGRGASALMAFAAAIKALLFRYTGQGDIVIGTTTAGRDRSELADQIGFYVNSLALRDRVDGRRSFADLLDQVRATAAGAYEHQEYPFDRLVDELALERDLSRSPLFDVMLVVNDDPDPSVELEGLRVSPFDHGSVAAKYDLTVDVARGQGTWNVRVIYDAGLYEAGRIERLLAHFEHLIGEAVARPDAPLAELDLLPVVERREIIARSRGVPRDHPQHTTLVEQFEAQAARTPDRPAIRTPGPGQAGRPALTYRELDARAGKLAATIAACVDGGIEPRVAVMLDRGEDLIAALLAVLKSGSAYLPLDPAWPAERLAWVLADAQAAAVVTSGDRIARVSALTTAHVIGFDRETAGAKRPPARTAAPAPHNLAYLIYTSGSTGTPKGVEVEHRSFVNMIASQIESFGVDPEDVVLQFASCSFDASLSEIFMALLSGACLVCPAEDQLKDPAALMQVLRDERVTVATLPPSYIRALGFDALSTLRTLVTAGEAAVPDEGAFASSGGRYWNAYGPTEFSVCATMGLVPPNVAPNQSVPIGRPIANSDLLIVERGGVELRPVGIPGEICLGGAGLARGYHARPAMTAASFVPHPLQSGRRMYRTGDLGCWREDGTVEFLGRLDHQIKVRGYRIEPGEIEVALRNQPGVTDALVLQRAGFLDAFVVSSDTDVDSLRAALASRLPAYMLPDRVVPIEEWPRLPSGKVDRAALPSAAAGKAAARMPPRNATERALVDIWRNVLGIAEVGIHDRFLDLGGNSMKAILMVSRVLRETGIKVPIRQVFEEGTIAALAASCGVAEDVEPIPSVPAASDYAVSHAQRRLWTIDRMEEGAGAYNIPGAVRLDGKVDLDRLRGALARLADRHESLRTTFIDRDGVPRQVVHGRLALDFEVEDLRASEAPEDAARRRIEADLTRPFDLAHGPLFRTRVYRTTENACIFYLNIHHAISDGGSLEVFFRDLVRLYGAPESARELPPLSVQYKDFAAWQNARVTDDRGQAALAYWRELLAGDRPLLDLPGDRPRPRVKSFRGGTVALQVDEALGRGLARLARDRGATMVALWLSLFYALIHRYTGADDVTVGVPATLRDHPDLDDQIGFFVNMMPLRLHLSPARSHSHLFDRVRALLREAFEYRHLPYDLLVEQVAVDRDLSRNPLFDIALSVQERDRASAAPAGTRPSTFPLAGATSKFDLTLFASESDDGRWDLTFEYDADLFDRVRIQRLAGHFLNLARSVLARPDAPLESLELIEEGERRLVCEEWTRTTAAYPREQSIASVFETLAAERPGHPAVEADDGGLTYGELNERANALASELVAEGIRLEEPIGVLLEPSASVAVALMGILKAGGAYVPLDPDTPPDRLAFLLNDVKCRLVISSAALLAESGPRHPQVRFLDVDRMGRSASNPVARAAGGNLAYIMYTSGSTGTPKGTLVEQRAVLRLVLGQDYVAWGGSDRVLQAGSLAFDASTFEIWGPLLNGGVVVFPPAGSVVDPVALTPLLRRHRITTMWVTASLFNQLVDHDPAIFAGLRQVLTGGERLSPAHVARVRATLPDLILTNGYGPTENTTFTTCHRIEECLKRDVPIGRPIANSSVYVLDRTQRPVPAGVPGEICAAGDGLARGYLGQPALTAERFVPHPFVRGARLYRTGDIGRWRADGALEILGRLDDQVKVRGYRVEPAEVETTMRHAGAVDAVVVPRVTSVGTTELVGYFTPASGLDPPTLRERLRARLPAHLVPSHLVPLDRLPLTPNGKVDKRALPDPEAVVSAVPAALQACTTPLELALSAAWAEVLGGVAPGLDDNYFDRGGDSIQAIQIASRLRRAGWLVKVRDIFQQPTIRQLAAVVRRAEADRAPAPDRSGAEQDAPLSRIQTWFFTRHAADRHHFNQSVLVRVPDPVDEPALARALSAIWRRHDALRATFSAGPDGALRQTIRSAAEPLVPSIVDFRAHPAPRAALQDHSGEVQRSFDLDRGPLVRVVVYRLPDGDRLFVTVHHLVVDVVSWRIVLEELEGAYRQAREAGAVDLGPAGSRYPDWIAQTNRMIQRGDFESERAYWAAADAAMRAALPYDLADAGPGTFGESDKVTLSLDEAATTDLLERTHRAYGAGVDESLLTALARALSRAIRPGPWKVSVESHGRESEALGLDLGRTVGWFTSLYPLVLEAPGQSIGSDIRRVKDAVRRVPRGGIGYAALGLLDPGRPPLVAFNYLGRFDGQATHAFTMADEAHGPDIGPSVERLAHLDVGGAIAGRRLQLTVTYSPHRFRRDTIEQLVDTIRAELTDLIGHCAGKRLPEKTPSDFTASALTLDEYDRVLGRAGLGATQVEDVYALAPLQAGLFFQHRLDPGSPAYHVQMDLALRGTIHAETYRQAWTELARRHPMLRTVFVDGDTRPLQVVLHEVAPEFAFEDLSSATGAEAAERLAAYRAAELARPFDLGRAPLWRVALFRTAPDRHRVIWSCHHILIDGWSLGLLHRQLGDVYGQLAERGSALPAPARPFADFARWLERADMARARAYWASYLDGLDGRTSLPHAPGAGRHVGYAFAERTFELDARVTSAVQRLAAALGVTPYTLIQAAWSVVLSRYTGASEVVFGSIVSGRPPGLDLVDEIVGPFINAVPVRVKIDAQVSFAALVGQLQQDLLQQADAHFVSLAEIQSLARAGSDLFDHLLVFENYPVDQALRERRASGLTIESFEAHDQSHYDLNMVIVPGKRLQFRISHNANVHPRDWIERMVGHLFATLDRASAAPGAPAAEIDILPAGEREAVVATFQGPHRGEDRAGRATVVDLFRRHVERTPDRTAVQDPAASLTYRALDEESDRVAAWLVDRHQIGRDDRVAVLLDRSPRLIAVLLGVLKAGGAYVPIDPNYPRDRIAFLLEDSGARAIVDDAETLWAGMPRAPGRPPRSPDAGDLAYVMYTSGSTGRPKGCQIEHRNLSHYLEWASRAYLDPGRSLTFGLYTSIAFDLTVTTLFLPLITGGAIRVPARELDAHDALREIFASDSGVDAVKLTPSHIALLPELRLGRTNVSLAIAGGEALTREHAAILRELNPEITVFNEYGPTETTVGCVVKRVEEADAEITIGRPIDDTRIYVLDDRRRPVPVGVPGEIYIGGMGVGRGYLRRPELTADRFVENPIEAAGGRCYRTGDLGRWLPNGEIEYLGRADDQIKLRGHRIEPGEIEAAIARCHGVDAVAVLARAAAGGADTTLVAYLTGTADVSAIRAALAAELPDVMIPSHFVVLDRMPLTPNGKLDRRALPDPAVAPAGGGEADAPLTSNEELVAGIWQRVLGIERVGRGDDFFALGGHSLKAAQVAAGIYHQTGVRISLKDFLASPKVANLAARLEARGAGARPTSIPPARVRETYPLSHAQRRLWLLHHVPGGDVAYNVPLPVVIEGQLDLGALERAFAALVERHEALRTAFVSLDGEPRQRIAPRVEASIRRVDLRRGDGGDAQARALVEAEARTPFDLSTPPLARLTVAALGGSPVRHLVVLTMHHIVGDGWSQTVLAREIDALYHAFRAGRPNPLPPLRIQYKDFAEWQNARDFAAEEAWWLARLAGAPDRIALPYDFPPAEDRAFRGATVEAVLDAATTRGLRALAASRRMTLAHTVLAIFQLVLYRLTGQPDLCVGMSVAGRTDRDLERLVGFFVNILPVRARFREDASLDALLAEVSQTATEAFDHQDYPFDLLVQRMQPQRAASGQPLVNVVFAFQNFADVHIDDGLSRRADGDGHGAARAFDFAFGTSKFDLTLFVEDESETLRLVLEYDTGLFLPATAGRHVDAIVRFAGLAAKSAPAPS